MGFLAELAKPGVRAWPIILAFAFPTLALAYDYPYADPYYATITTAVLKVDHLDKSLRYSDVPLRVRPDRDEVPLLGRRNKITLRVWTQSQRAPLVVMVAGLGGGSNVSYHNYLASQFYQRGFHVVVFPSPFHWTFTHAASASAFPGLTRADAADLYDVMVAGLAEVRERKHVEASSVGLLGVSMGALESAYVSELDAREQNIGFKRVLLINPPLDPLYSADVLDSLAKKGDELTPEDKKNLRERSYLFGLDALTKGDIKSPGYFLDFETRFPTTLAERQFLIGSSLKEFLGPMIFASQQVRDLGLLKNPIATDRPDDRLAEAANFSFRDYLERFLLPGTGYNSLEEVRGQVNLDGVDAHLRRDPRVILLHNADDFIVNEGQLAYLQNVFGARMTLFPHGGHVGNVWYGENLAKILGVFEGME